MSDKERIEEIRIFLGFNKTKFSKVIGFTTPQSYTNYLNGSNNLSIKMIKALKKHNSKISIDWILEGQGQMLLDSLYNGGNIQSATNRDGSITQVNDSGSIKYGTKDGTIEVLKNENDHLKKEISLLEKSLTDKERLIQILEKNQK